MLQPFETLDPSNKQKNKKQNVEQIKNNANQWLKSLADSVS